MDSATKWKSSNTAEGKNPKWKPNENVSLETSGGQYINLQLWDKDTGGSDDLIGSGILDI